VARIALVGIRDEPGRAFTIFSLLARKKISVDIILQSIGRHNTKDISFTVNDVDLEETIKVLNEARDLIGFDHLSHDENIAKLSIVGAGMATNPGVASMMFEALYDAGVNIHMISTSEIKISVLIDAKDAEKGANYVHDRCIAI
jgi:aspartate kinase